MIKKEELLWKVLRATTNSPNDIWKESHYVRHRGAPKNLLNKPKSRYTVPIKKIVDIKDDEIYLVVQFCAEELRLPFFVIERNAFSKDLKFDEEFVYAFNVRLCFKTEFKIKHRKQLNVSGEVKQEYRASVFNDAINIIRSKPRYRLMNLILSEEKYKNFNRDQLKSLIYSEQYDREEKEFKGIKETQN